MNWDPKYRYKVFANIIKSNGEYIFVLDLLDAEAVSLTPSNEKVIFLPKKMKYSFGTPFLEHEKYIEEHLLSGYTRTQIIENKKVMIKPKPKENEQLNLFNNENNQSI